MNTVTVWGKHHLNEEELADRSQQLAETLHQLGCKEDEKKQAMKQLASDIEILKLRTGKLKDAIRDGYESGQIVCREEKDYGLQVKRYVSIEHGELIKTEPFSEEDRQMHLKEGVA